MSLINQVLQDLDKRGARTDIGEATIRVVHMRKGPSALLWLLLGAAGAAALGGAAWWVWMRPLPGPALPAKPVTAPAAVVLPQPQSAVLVAASQPLVPLPPAPPPLLLERITPNPVQAGSEAQLITLHGQHFSPGVTVSLRNPKGVTYANRPVREQTDTTLVLKVNFGNRAGDWTVVVRDAAGKHSAEQVVTVQARGAPAQPRPPVVAKPAPAATAPAATAVTPGVNKQPTRISPQQQAENEYLRALQLLRQGHGSEAMVGFEQALQLYPGHELARQSLVSLLLEQKRIADAERLLQAGLQINPQQSSFAMLLARLQVEQGNVGMALDTLQKTLPYADRQADYLAFVAALLQRQNRHAEAVVQYQKALQLKPQAGVWQMGLGISLRAEQHTSEAREAFQRALDSNSLNAELQAYVRQQLKEL